MRDEAAASGDTGRLLPITIDDSEPPIGFRQFHCLDLAGWKGRRDRRTGELLDALKRRLQANDTTRGVVTQGADAASARLDTSKRTWIAVTGLGILLVAFVAFFLVTTSRSRHARPRHVTMALLPFTATSSDAGLSDIAAQSRDSVSHALTQSGIAVRVLSAPQESKEAGDFTISGEFSRTGNNLLATVRLDDVAHGVTVFTKRFEASGQLSQALPERIGAQIAGTIAWAAPLIELELRHPSDPTVTADLLGQLEFLNDPLQGYQSAKRAVAKDPDSAFAHVALAFDTAFSVGRIPRDQRAGAVAAARAAAEQAIKLAPEFGDTYAAPCYLQSESLLRDCEDRLRRRRQMDPTAPFLDAFLSGLLRLVGRSNEAGQLAELSYTHDPYVPTKISWMLRHLEFRGQSSDAESLYRQGVRWWPEFRDNFFRSRLAGLMQRNDWPAVRRLERHQDERPSDYVDSAPLVAALNAKSPTAARRACSTESRDYTLGQRCLMIYIALGDLDDAFLLADRFYPARIGRTPAETERIWLDAPDGAGPLDLITSPAAAPLRRDRRYLALAQRVGLLDYWRSGRLPDFCGANPEPVCRDLRGVR